MSFPASPRVGSLLAFVVALMLAEPGCRKQDAQDEPRGEAQARPETAATPPPAPPPVAVSLDGAVTAEGAGVSGARVCAWKRGPRLWLVRDDVLEPSCATTDASGSFSLSLASGAWFVVASARGHLPAGEHATLRASRPGARIELELRRGGQVLAGRLVDPTGAAIPGARVHANSDVGERVWPAASTTTDAAGRFELWAGEDAELEAIAPGFIHRLTVPTREGEWALLPESVLVGRVVDEAGRGVPGAKVTYTERLGSPLGSPRNATFTDAAGEFRLDGLAPDRYDLVAFRSDIGGMAKPVHVGYGETVEGVEVVLDQHFRTVRARVVERGGEPVADCMVNLGPKDGDPRRGTWFVTDEEGLLEVPGAQVHRYVVHDLSCRGLAGAPPYEAIPVGSRAANIPTLEVTRGALVRGRLLDAAGEPVANRQLWLERTLPESDPNAPRELHGDFMNHDEVTTDAEGRYEFRGVPPGRFRVLVSDYSGIGERPEIEVSGAEVVEASFTMPPTGRVELQSSRALAGQHFRLEHCGLLDPTDSWRYAAVTDARGRAIVERAPVGELRVGLDEQVNCYSQPKAGVTIQVRAGETTDVGLAAAHPEVEAQLLVRVLSPTGEPAAGAVLELDSLGGAPVPERLDWTLLRGDRFAITDAEGRARFELVPARRPTAIVAARRGEFASALVERDHAGELVLRLSGSLGQ